MHAGDEGPKLPRYQPHVDPWSYGQSSDYANQCHVAIDCDSIAHKISFCDEEEGHVPTLTFASAQ